MNDEQFVKLMKYLDKRFDEVNEHIDHLEKRTDERFDTLTNIVDGYASKLETYTLEMAAMQHKIDRLERYIQVLADKNGVNLDAIHA